MAFGLPLFRNISRALKKVVGSAECDELKIEPGQVAQVTHSVGDSRDRLAIDKGGVVVLELSAARL